MALISKMAQSMQQKRDTLSDMYKNIIGNDHQFDSISLSARELREREDYVLQRYEAEQRQYANAAQNQLANSYGGGMGQAISGQHQMMNNALAAQQSLTGVSMAHIKQMQMQMQRQAAAKEQDFDPNKREAFNAPLSTLEDMWVTKYGDMWVNSAVPAKDDFWDDAYTRLNSAGRFEVVRGWVKLKG